MSKINIRKIFDKIFSTIVAVLSIISLCIMLVAFIDANSINEFIIKLANNKTQFSIIIFFLLIYFVYSYICLIRKIIKSRKINIFLSYSDYSRTEMNKIKDILVLTNNYKIYDFDSIQAGQDIEAEIKRMVAISKRIIVLYDEGYTKTDYCSIGLKAIIESKKPVIPLLKSIESVSKLPTELSKFKPLIISSNDESWKKAFEHSLHQQYNR